jgi:hypothetical protein
MLPNKGLACLKIMSVLTGTLFPFLLQAQILNVDKTDTTDYIRRAKINFDFITGLEVDKQKTVLYDATNTAELMWQQYKELFILAGSYRFTYNGPDDIMNAGFIHLRYRHAYKAKIQPEPFFQYQWDNKRGIERRILAGANARYNITKGQRFDFNCALGLMYEEEKWDYVAVDSAKIPADVTPVLNKLLKINSYIRLTWKPNENNFITCNVFLQTRPDRFKPRLAPNAQWNVKVGKHVDLAVSFTGLYDTSPVVPIEKFYFSFSDGILLNL